MLRFLKNGLIALMGFLICSVLHASQMLDKIDLAPEVQPLQNRQLAQETMNAAYMKGQQITINKYIELQRHGINTLTSMGVSGYGSSVIVWDTAFEPDEYNDLDLPENATCYSGLDMLRNIPHGTSVAACLSSRYPGGHGLAFGAKVYTCNTDSWIDDLQRIETIINNCTKARTPSPRVINMSMICSLRPSYLDTYMKRLTDILQYNDMLMVIAAGNNGKLISQDDPFAPNSIDLRTKVLAYPDLLKHIIFVGATESGTPTQASWYSNRAGELKDHVVFANGLLLQEVTLFLNGILSKDCTNRRPEGTSFAAPIVASLIDVLFKYFPLLDSQDIKQIILSSAAKLKGFDAEVLGHGGIDPLKAWISALEFQCVCGPFAPKFYVHPLFFKDLQGKLGELTTLDLSGTAGLNEAYDELFRAVGRMHKLRSLSLLDTDLDGHYLQFFPSALLFNSSLREVKLTLPKLLTAKTFLTDLSSGWLEIKDLEGLALLSFATVTSPIWVLSSMLTDTREYSYTPVCKSLAEIPHLTKLTIGFSDTTQQREWVKKEILKYRKAKGNDKNLDFSFVN